MVKLQKIYFISFIVLIGSCFALINNTNGFSAFKGNSTRNQLTINSKVDAFNQAKHQPNALNFLTEILDSEEESDNEEDNSNNHDDERSGANYPKSSVIGAANKLLEIRPNLALEHHFSHQSNSSRIPVYKRVCVFRI